MLVLKKPLILPFLLYNQQPRVRIDSYEISNSPHCVKTEIIDPTAPPQQLHKRGTIFLGHPVDTSQF